MDSTRDNYYKRPIIPLLLSLAVGILIGDLVPHHMYLPFLLCFVSFVIIVREIRRKTPLIYTPLILFATLGYLLIQSGFRSDQSPSNVGFYIGKGECTIKGTIETTPELKRFGQKFTLGRLSVGLNPGEETPVFGKINVTAADGDASFKKGDRLNLVSKIKSFRNFYNPNGFDYEHFMALQGIYGSAYGKKGDVTLLEPAIPSQLETIRNSVEAFIDKTPVSGQTKEVLKALSTGTRTGISKELNNEFNITGTTHLLSISGLHVSIVSTVAFFIFCRIFSFFPAVLWRGRVKMVAGILTLIPVWFYGLLAGLSPSTLRSVIMISVFLLTYSFEAEHDVINSLTIAAMVILALAPESLFSVSFQLSFSAVFFIVWGMDTIGSRISSDNENQSVIVQSVKNYLLVSLFAFVGTWPLISHYFNQMSLIGFVANMILIPLVGSLVVILELAAIFCYPILVTPASLLMWLAGFVLEKSLYLIHLFAMVPFSSLKTVTPSYLEMVAYYALAMAVIVLMGRGESSPEFRKKMAALAALAMVIMGIDAAYWIQHRFLHRDLRITYLDVGQGNSALIEFPKGKCMLIDGGGFSDNDSFDIGEKVVAPLLWSMKIAKIDTVVLSHPDSDHMNGLLYILKNFSVDELWKSDEKKDSKSYERLLEIVKEEKINAPSFADLTKQRDINGVSTQILWPQPDADSGLDDTRDSTLKDDNAVSLVLKISYGGQSFLFPGDITKEAEADMVSRTLTDLQSSVLLVPHHGSGGSSSELFLATVKPKYAVISVGYHNKYRMPHKKTLGRLEDQGISAYRTDKNGAILMSVSGNALDIKTILKGNRGDDGDDGS
jgi:competence protein ComEC